MKKALKIAGLILTVLVLALAAVIVPVMSSMHPGLGPDLPAPVHQVKGSFVNCYILETGDAGKSVCLVDTGADTKAAQIIEVLKSMGLGPENVSAIFLTHSHSDHAAGVAAFPKAQLYALQSEAGLLDGTETYHSPISMMGRGRDPHQPRYKLTRGLKDGEVLTLGKLSITAFAVPGHTAGSAAYLAGGVLFMGDAASATKGGCLNGTVWLFSGDQAQGTKSLKDLAIRLKPRAEEIRFITTAHGGNLAGFGALERY